MEESKVTKIGVRFEENRMTPPAAGDGNLGSHLTAFYCP